MVLIQASRLTGEQAYLEAALSNLDYVLGRNATGYSFVTGHGDITPVQIHHRQSESDAVPEPVPGLPAGGPNAGRQDNCAYPSTLPAKSYVDDWCSYASNEVTINWNAPFVYLAGAIEATMSPSGLPVPASAGRKMMAAGSHEATLDVSDWVAGLYLVRLESATAAVSCPLMVVR